MKNYTNVQSTAIFSPVFTVYHKKNSFLLKEEANGFRMLGLWTLRMSKSIIMTEEKVEEQKAKTVPHMMKMTHIEAALTWYKMSPHVNAIMFRHTLDFSWIIAVERLFFFGFFFPPNHKKKHHLPARLASGCAAHSCCLIGCASKKVSGSPGQRWNNLNFKYVAEKCHLIPTTLCSARVFWLDEQQYMSFEFAVFPIMGRIKVYFILT